MAASELLALPPLPPLEWQYLGVIYGTAAKALNFLRGVWIIFPRQLGALEGRKKGRDGGGGERSLGVGLVRARTASALAAGILLKAPP